MKKKFLAGLLAVVMILTMLPVNALAAGAGDWYHDLDGFLDDWFKGHGDCDKEYDLYFYTVVPGYAWDASGAVDEIWNGMGVGTISGVKKPDDYSVGTGISGDKVKITEPSSYPDINGCKYAAPGSENAGKVGYYTIEWKRTVVSSGANAGKNGVNPVVEKGNTFHRDGIVIFGTEQPQPPEQTYTVTYLPGDHGALSGTTSFPDLKAGDPTPAAPTVMADTGYRHVGWNPERTDTVTGDARYTAVYEKDDGQTKTLSYTVEYYKDGVRVDGDTQTVTKTVQVLEPDTLAVDQKQINTTDKYYGYKFAGTNPATIPAEVASGTTIKVYYVLDNEAVKTLSYTVEYYKDGVRVDRDTQTVTKTVQVLEPDTLAVDKSQINTTDKYRGCWFAGTDPSPIPDVIQNGGVIKVYYRSDVDPGYTVTKTVKESYAWVGDTIHYTVKVKNTGDQTLNNLLVVDDMLGVREYIKELKSGKTWEKTYEYVVQRADAGEKLCNTVTVWKNWYTKVEAESGYTRISATLPALNTTDHVAYIIGYDDGTIRPNGTITRAETATIFFRLLTDDTRAYYWSKTNSFTDVPSNAWYNNAVSTLEAAGVIVDSRYTFRPADAITRAEFAVMAAQFTGLTTNRACSFTDVSRTHWAAEAIAVVEQQGWIEGYPDGTFRPDETISRAEAMAIVNRMLERAVEEAYMLPHMVTWTDCSSRAWYYADVQEATNSHEFRRLTKKVPGESYCYEEWVKLLKNPDWAALEKTWSKANSK
ncbi:MAG: S-layer homology domain-containing protein [Candidatus Avoscillospira sp.]